MIKLARRTQPAAPQDRLPVEHVSDSFARALDLTGARAIQDGDSDVRAAVVVSLAEYLARKHTLTRRTR